MPRMEEFADAEMVVYASDPPTRRTRKVDAGQEAAMANVNRRHVPLTIVAQDPSVTRTPGDTPLTAKVDVPTEPLQPGPRGQRFFVVDFTAGSGAWSGPHVLTAGSGSAGEPDWAVVDVVLQPTREQIIENETFHAQNVYATCAATLAKFEQTLGRRIPWRFGAHQLYLIPHAFVGANAHYSPDDRCISFGFLPGTEEREPVYTCLSHDIIAHELTHAILDGLRPRYIEPGLPDQIAFHEGFADIVALLSVFALPDIVELALGGDAQARPATGDEPVFVNLNRFSVERLKSNVLFGLGEQLGHSIDPAARALRNALLDVPLGGEWRTQRAFDIPHRRGEVIVAAVCQAVAAIWWDRLADIRRHGKVPLRRAAEEGGKVAEQVLGMCIRALDYLPPIDFDFGDFVDAILAADEVVAPDDVRDYRTVVTDAFAMYDIHPPARIVTTSGKLNHRWMLEGINLRALATSPQEVFRFVRQNSANFDLDLDLHLRIERVVAATRTGPDGLVVEEIIADYTQTVSAKLRDLPRAIRNGVTCPKDTEVQIWGGGVIVFDQFGIPRHHVSKNLARSAADRERQRQRLTYLADNHVFDTSHRLGFSTGRTDAARFQMLHDDENSPSERW